MSWGKYPSIEERDLVHGTPIKVYKNGDPWFPGKRVVVNQRQHPTFESFLNYLTSTLKEERAVRRLYTPNHGTRITDYDQIKPENVYVTSHALGSNEHLKRIRWDVHTFFSISLSLTLSLFQVQFLGVKHVVFAVYIDILNASNLSSNWRSMLFHGAKVMPLKTPRFSFIFQVCLGVFS